MKLKPAILPLSSLIFIAFCGSATAQITSGKLVVERIGTGGAALSSTSTAVFLDQFNTTGTGQTASGIITIPTTGGTRLTNSGSASSEGLVTVSPNGLSLTIAGYDAAAGVASIVNSASSANARVADIISADGTVTRAGSTSSVFSANNIRSAVTNGTDVWAVGGNSGVYDLTNSTTVSSTVTNARQIGIFAGSANGQLYLSTGSGTQGIYSVGSGTPTTTGQAATVMISTNALGGGSSPYAFSINTSKSVAYVADSSAGISKYTSSNGGSTWIRNGTYANTLSGSSGTTGVTVDWSNPNAPVVFASSPTNLYKLTDTGGTGAASYGTATNLATAATNTAFRGVQLGVMPSVWTKAATNGSTTEWNTSTAATQNSNWSTIQASGSNIAFQNVNTGSSALNLTISNTSNSPVTNASSIEFKSGGYGGGSGNTLYTVSGTTEVTLSGTSSTSAIGTFTANSTTFTSVIANNSGVTQTVSIPLTLGASNQAFRASSGDLAINGTVTNGGNTLTVGGAANTTFGSSAAISGNGGLTKVEAGVLTLTGTSTYIGATQVNAGTLVVGVGSVGSLTSAVTVTYVGSKLGGSGTVTGNVTINGGAILSPGNSPGILTVAGDTTFNTGSIFEWELFSNTDAAGERGVAATGYDGVDITGDNRTVSVDSNAIFRVVLGGTADNIDGGFWNTSHSWNVFDLTGTGSAITSAFSAFQFYQGGSSMSYSTEGTFAFDQGSGNLTWTAVPEPTSALAGLLITAGLLRRRRVA